MEKSQLTHNNTSGAARGRPRKERTASFVGIGRKAYEGKTKAWGWLEPVLSEAEGMVAFSCHHTSPLKHLSGLCRFLLENQKKEKG